MERKSEYYAKGREIHLDIRGGIDFSMLRGACVKENVNGMRRSVLSTSEQSQNVGTNCFCNIINIRGLFIDCDVFIDVLCHIRKDEEGLCIRRSCHTTQLRIYKCVYRVVTKERLLNVPVVRLRNKLIE